MPIKSRIILAEKGGASLTSRKPGGREMPQAEFVLELLATQYEAKSLANDNISNNASLFMLVWEHDIGQLLLLNARLSEKSFRRCILPRGHPSMQAICALQARRFSASSEGSRKPTCICNPSRRRAQVQAFVLPMQSR